MVSSTDIHVLIDLFGRLYNNTDASKLRDSRDSLDDPGVVSNRRAIDAIARLCVSQDQESIAIAVRPSNTGVSLIVSMSPDPRNSTIGHMGWLWSRLKVVATEMQDASDTPVNTNVHLSTHPPIYPGASLHQKWKKFREMAYEFLLYRFYFRTFIKAIWHGPDTYSRWDIFCKWVEMLRSRPELIDTPYLNGMLQVFGILRLVFDKLRDHDFSGPSNLSLVKEISDFMGRAYHHLWVAQRSEIHAVVREQLSTGMFWNLYLVCTSS